MQTWDLVLFAHNMSVSDAAFFCLAVLYSSIVYGSQILSRLFSLLALYKHPQMLVILSPTVGIMISTFYPVFWNIQNVNMDICQAFTSASQDWVAL